jgi:hypothetical protein
MIQIGDEKKRIKVMPLAYPSERDQERRSIPFHRDEKNAREDAH